LQKVSSKTSIGWKHKSYDTCDLDYLCNHFQHLCHWWYNVRCLTCKQISLLSMIFSPSLMLLAIYYTQRFHAIVFQWKHKYHFTEYEGRWQFDSGHAIFYRLGKKFPTSGSCVLSACKVTIWNVLNELWIVNDECWLINVVNIKYLNDFRESINAEMAFSNNAKEEPWIVLWNV
jgi:hypothetical protein